MFHLPASPKGSRPVVPVASDCIRWPDPPPLLPLPPHALSLLPQNDLACEPWGAGGRPRGGRLPLPTPTCPCQHWLKWIPSKHPGKQPQPSTPPGTDASLLLRVGGDGDEGHVCPEKRRQFRTLAINAALGYVPSGEEGASGQTHSQPAECRHHA